ncbi:MAG TPA: hypothetical protein ENH34_01320 [Phycisphaerales bacterium]|nr:hypothetical protein [Phycisphaerales bacterium]
MTDENPNSESEAQDSDAQEGKDIGDLLNKAEADLRAIEKHKKTIEGYSKELLTLKVSAENDSEAAHTAREESEKSKKSATEDAKAVQALKTEAEPLLAKIKANQTEAVALLGEIKTSKDDAKRIAEIADEKDKKVDEYEKQLKGLITQYSKLNEQVESLLPGATGSNLAFASKARKESFKRPKFWWAILQLIAIGLLVGVGIWTLYTTDISTIKDAIFFILLRSPIIAAIILLEEFARRNRNIALRLEEDYGYKEVLSASFEGYKKEMEKIDLETKTLAVTKLSTNLLDAMAKEPGRLIDKEKPESVGSFLSKSTLSQITIPEGESKEGVLCRIYEDIKKSFKGKIINIVIIIALSIAAGIGIGYYIGLTFPSS